MLSTFNRMDIQLIPFSRNASCILKCTNFLRRLSLHKAATIKIHAYELVFTNLVIFLEIKLRNESIWNNESNQKNDLKNSSKRRIFDEIRFK